MAPDSNGTPIPPETTSFRFSYLATSNDIGIYNSSGQDSISTLDEAFGGTGVDVWLSSLPTEVGDIVTRFADGVIERWAVMHCEWLVRSRD